MEDKIDIVYIVILHHNNFRCSDYCLSALREADQSHMKLVLVDNASDDGSYKALLTKYPECIEIRNKENLGFARGTNVGLRWAYNEGAEYFMLLNNDVEVTPGFIAPMLNSLKQNTVVGLVTPKILYRQDRQKIWHAGGFIKLSTITAIARGYDEVDKGQYDNETSTEWASGACCLFSRRLLDTIGFLEERYFFGQEEWDFSTSTIRANFKILYEPRAVVFHEIGQSSRKSPSLYAYQLTYNKFTYARKFLQFFSFYRFTCLYILYILLYFPKKDLHTLTNSSDFYIRTAKRAAFWGVRDFFKNVYITASQLDSIDERLKRYLMKNNRSKPAVNIIDLK